MRIHPVVEKMGDMASNQYLILEPAHLTLIDTGLAANAGRILRSIEELGLLPTDLKTILITHADGDHYGALAALVAVSGAQVMTSAPEAEAIRTGGSSREIKTNGQFRWKLLKLASRFFRTEPAQVDRILTPGEELPIWGGLQVLDTRGHTPGHLSFFHAPSRTLFCGDSIIRGPNQLRPAFGANCWDETLAQEAFERQMSMSPARICGGHVYKSWEETPISV